MGTSIAARPSIGRSAHGSQHIRALEDDPKAAEWGTLGNERNADVRTLSIEGLVTASRERVDDRHGCRRVAGNKRRGHRRHVACVPSGKRSLIGGLLHYLNFWTTR